MDKYMRNLWYFFGKSLKSFRIRNCMFLNYYDIVLFFLVCKKEVIRSILEFKVEIGLLSYKFFLYDWWRVIICKKRGREVGYWVIMVMESVVMVVGLSCLELLRKFLYVGGLYGWCWL